MRNPHLLIAALVIVPLLGSDSPRDYDDATQDAGIEGDWLLIRVEVDGEALRDEKADRATTYRAGNFCWGGLTDGTYTIDSRFRPARLTEHTLVSDTTYRNVFQIDGNTLRVAYLKSQSDYPTGFRDRRELIVEVYRRVR
jgi:uncharacterized protein (TIGR03067 family)